MLASHVMLHIALFAAPFRRDHGEIDCKKMVKPVDVAPVRSPQDVHSIIAWHVRGKSVVEVGTRNGDGMACFAQVASSAIAVELAAAYCSKLQVRAAELQNATGHTFSVMCKDYRTAPGLDADVFTWWQETPHLHNPAILMSLRWLQERGQIRKDAVAIMVFDTGWGDDMDDFQNLHRLGWPSWSATVDGVNERAGCLTHFRHKPYVCNRVTNGTYHVMGLELNKVGLSCADHHATDRWKARCSRAKPPPPTLSG